MAGKQLFARITVRFQPWAGEGKGVRVTSSCPAEQVPPALLTAAQEELKLCSEGGGAIGSFPLAGLQVTITHGEAHADNSDDVAFRIAAADAFEKGLRAGGPVLLEPVMKLDITAPEEFVGDIMGDLNKRRAIIHKTENRGTAVSIVAHAPLRELFGYANAIRSLSQGRAGCSMEPKGYAPAPAEVARQYAL
jgi:elongation factor G